MGDVIRLPKKRGVDPTFAGAFGICCSFQQVGVYTLAQIHCRFTGEVPAKVTIHVRDQARVVIKKINDRSKERGEVVFLVAADPPLKYAHIMHMPTPGLGEHVMCVLTEDLALRLDGNLDRILEWEGTVEIPWSLFDAL